jgi:hypothetical protein
MGGLEIYKRRFGGPTMRITDVLLAIIAVLLTAIFLRSSAIETDKALAGTNTPGRYQIAAAGEKSPKAYIVDTAEGRVWIVDTARIIKSYDLLHDL